MSQGHSPDDYHSEMECWNWFKAGQSVRYHAKSNNKSAPYASNSSSASTVHVPPPSAAPSRVAHKQSLQLQEQRHHEASLPAALEQAKKSDLPDLKDKAPLENNSMSVFNADEQLLRLLGRLELRDRASREEVDAEYAFVCATIDRVSDGCSGTENRRRAPEEGEEPHVETARISLNMARQKLREEGENTGGVIRLIRQSSGQR